MVYGYSSDFTGFPDLGFGLAILNDVDSAGGINDKIKAHAVRLLFESLGRADAPDLPRPIALPDDALRHYPGRYRADPETAWALIDGEQLVVSTLGVDKRFIATASDTFVSDDLHSFGLPVRFTVPTDREPPIMDVGGTVYRRVGDYQPDRHVPAELSRFVGTFGKPHCPLRITVEDGALICLIEWHHRYALEHLGGHSYRFPSFGLFEGEEVRFVEAPNGEITAVIVGVVRFERAG